MAKKNSFDTVLNVGYLLVIVLVFSPLTFLISHTFQQADLNCYASPRPLLEDQSEDYYDELDSCLEQQAVIDKSNAQLEFFIVSLVSIIAVSALLIFSKSIVPLISYGLFFGSALNTIIIVIKHSFSSILATLTGAVLFVLLLVFINRQLKKK